VLVGIGLIDQYTDDLRDTIAHVRTSEADDGDLDSFLDAAHRLHPLRRLQYLPNIDAAVISILHGAPDAHLVSGVAAGLQAIVSAAAMIGEGRTDAVLCGGVDARFTPPLLAAAAEELDLSESCDPDTTCCPFDRRHSVSSSETARPCCCWRQPALQAGRGYAALVAARG
jgi:3-oxoacyl-(acyl-carrier-protein) synthase